jgi:hypothetical protein
MLPFATESRIHALLATFSTAPGALLSLKITEEEAVNTRAWSISGSYSMARYTSLQVFSCFGAVLGYAIKYTKLTK